MSAETEDAQFLATMTVCKCKWHGTIAERIPLTSNAYKVIVGYLCPKCRRVGYSVPSAETLRKEGNAKA